MTPAEKMQREQIIHAALTARSEGDVEAAIQDLDGWVREHPEDDSIRDAYEPLVLNQMAFASQRSFILSQPAMSGNSRE